MHAIYLDYMATTPIDPQVIAKMRWVLESSEYYGNSTSLHSYGVKSAELIEIARQQVADLVRCDAREIIWTSGATEANNLALKGAAIFYERQGRHIITMASEHKSVVDTCRYLSHLGFEITYINPEKDGLLDIEKLKAALRTDTILVSIMHVNNETGVIQDIARIGNLLKERGIMFHVDAAQSAGKIPLDLKSLNVDLMSFSAHKIYGPKGIGALYVRSQPRLHLAVQLHGGGQERGLRSGTLPTHQIVGMGEAFAVTQKKYVADQENISRLRRQLLKGLHDIGDIHFNGSLLNQIEGCLNIRVPPIINECLLDHLPGLAVSSGSACNQVSAEPSAVLRSMGFSAVEANQSIRLSWGRFTTEQEITVALHHLREKINFLRHLAPASLNGNKNHEIFELLLKFENDCVMEANFKALGSAALLRAGQPLCDWLKKKSRQEFSELTLDNLNQILKLKPTQVNIALMIHSAVQKFIS